MVMPRSRSMSIRSRYWARICRASTTPVICSIRSASVDLPWSMWAMMQKLRMSSGVVAPGSSVGWHKRPFLGPSGGSIVPCPTGTGRGLARSARSVPPDQGRPAVRRYRSAPSWRARFGWPYGYLVIWPFAYGAAVRCMVSGVHLASRPIRCQGLQAPEDEGCRVANIKSQIKRNRQNEKARMRNKSVKSVSEDRRPQVPRGRGRR